STRPRSPQTFAPASPRSSRPAGRSTPSPNTQEGIPCRTVNPASGRDREGFPNRGGSMSTLTVADVPLGAENPAQRLRRIAAAVRVRLRWWGVHRALTPSQEEEMGDVASADGR